MSAGCTPCNGFGRIRLSTWGGSVLCYLCNGSGSAPPVKQGGRYESRGTAASGSTPEKNPS